MADPDLERAAQIEAIRQKGRSFDFVGDPKEDADTLIDYMYCNVHDFDGHLEDLIRELWDCYCYNFYEFMNEWRQRCRDEIDLAMMLKTNVFATVWRQYHCVPHNYSGYFAQYACLQLSPLTRPMLCINWAADMSDTGFSSDFDLVPNVHTARFFANNCAGLARWEKKMYSDEVAIADISMWIVIGHAVRHGWLKCDAPPRTLRLLLAIPPAILPRLLIHAHRRVWSRNQDRAFFARQRLAPRSEYIKRAVDELFPPTPPADIQTRFPVGRYLLNKRDPAIRLTILRRWPYPNEPTDPLSRVDWAFHAIYNNLMSWDPVVHYEVLGAGSLEQIQAAEKRMLADELDAVLMLMDGRFYDIFRGPAPIMPTRMSLAHTPYIINFGLRLSPFAQSLAGEWWRRYNISCKRPDPALLTAHPGLPDRRIMTKLRSKFDVYPHLGLHLAPDAEAFLNAAALFASVLLISDGILRLQPSSICGFYRVVARLPMELQVRLCACAYPALGQYWRTLSRRGWSFERLYLDRAIEELLFFDSS